MPAEETNTRKIISRRERERWINVSGGSHDKFTYLPGVIIVVPRHRRVSPGVARSIAKWAGWDERSEKMMYYVGILDGADDAWGVRIPDCPGCHGGGATPEAAISDVISALREWAAEMRADGVAVPAARTTAEILADPEDHPDVAAGESAVLIPLMLDAGRTVRANVTFDAGLLEAIDAEAERRGLTRSAFLASAAREKIEARR